MNHNWYAVISVQTLLAKDISNTQKILLALIANMSNERKYCYATNSYLAELLNVSPGTVSQIISDLENKGYLGRILIFKKGTAEVEARFLTVIEKYELETPSIEKDIPLPLNSNIPPLENIYTPPLENIKGNNKVFNNKENKESASLVFHLKIKENKEKGIKAYKPIPAILIKKEEKIELSSEEIIKSKKQGLYNLIKRYKDNNPDKYPAKIYNDFYRHWGEVSKNGKNIIRYDEQKFFEIGKRLATFWSRLSTEEKSKLWQLEKDKPKTGMLL